MNPWIEAMRLRTLPVSVAGVIMAAGYALQAGGPFKWLPWVLCLAFAVLAQIASNFANEYYDFKAGLDRQGREGPRRGVTEGDISPHGMLMATYGTLAVACCIGLSLIYWGGWWLIAAGMLIAAGVIAYSAGPYPLSHHCLGEVAVIFFFGIIPVNLTVYLLTGEWSVHTLAGSVAAGLLSANVLIVNNYRDVNDDEAVGKNTLAVVIGAKATSTLYIINALLALLLTATFWAAAPDYWLLFPITWVALYLLVWLKLRKHTGRTLNPVLGMTAVMMLLYCAAFTVCAICTLPPR